MAVITLGDTITGIRGSVNGISYHSGRAGIIMSRKPLQKKSVTQSQSQSNSTFLSLISSWIGISGANKILWNDYADLYPKTDKFGNERILTGMNYFQSINYYSQLFQAALLSSPPNHDLPAGVPPYTIQFPNDLMQIVFNIQWNPVNTGIAVFATQPTGRITTKNRSAYKLLGTFNSANYLQVDIFNEYISVFGSGIYDVLINQTVWFAVMIVPVHNISFESGVGNMVSQQTNP